MRKTLYTQLLTASTKATSAMEALHAGLILGFDIQGTLLEQVVLRFDSRNEMVIHAMPARKQYLKLLSQQ